VAERHTNPQWISLGENLQAQSAENRQKKSLTSGKQFGKVYL